MPEMKIAQQPREWKRSQMLERNLEPGFEQRGDKLERHYLNFVFVCLFVCLFFSRKGWELMG